MEIIISWIESVWVAVGLKPWAFTVFLIVLATLLFNFVQRRLMKYLGQMAANSENLWDNALHHAAGRPVTLIIWLIGITMAAQAIPVEGEGQILDANLIVKLRQIGVLFGIAWFLVTFVKNIEKNIIENARRDERKIDQTTVNALGRVVRITIIVTVMLIALDTMGVNVSGLLAAGGIGGLAVGLAAKDMLANFFGGITVYVDRPFSVGDWIVLKEKGIEGVVENIGWRQTTIRKFDKRPVYVPNAIFTTASVENPSRMSRRRINETIGLRYDDLNRMEAITDEVREMLNAHPEIDQKQTLMVQFNAFNASSVDFFIYCMTHTVNWEHYHKVKQDVLLKIQEIVNNNDAPIAFPTRTLKFDMSPESVGLETAPEKTATREVT